METLEQALFAEKCGANRVELCANLKVGGLTPPDEMIEKVIKALRIPVMVMVRPRAGSFVFSEKEMAEMESAILRSKKMGAAGVVIGNLTADNGVNLAQTSRLSKFAWPMQVTFHKAVDETPDLVASVKMISQIAGIQRILTSGGKVTALEGAANIRKMISAAGKHLTILSAGKVTVENLKMVHEKIGGKEYHGRRIVF